MDIKTGNISGSGTTNIAGGDINIIQPPHLPTASAFFTIEAPPADFTGREEELQQLLSAFDSSHSALLCGMTGSGGIGKTVLARLAAQKLADRFPYARLEINLQGTSHPPLDPAEAMRRLLAPFYPAQKLPDNPAELRGLYLSTFRQHAALLLLDNACDAAQVRALLPEPPSAAIVTSRLGFSLPEKGLQPLKLNLLPKDEARLLLRKVSPRLVSESDDSLVQLANICGSLPLALRVAGSLFESRPDWSLPSYHQRLNNEHARLSLLTDPDDPDLNVRACLALSYDCLPAELQLYFRQLGVFAAPFDLPALSAVWDNTGKINSTLGLLLKRHLLDYSSETGQYALHDLTRLYALERLCKDNSEAKLSLERYAKHFLTIGSVINEQYQKGGENIIPALRAFASVRLHLWAAWRRLAGQEPGWPLFEGADRWLSDFSSRVAYLLDLYLPPRERIPLLESTLAAARRLGDRGGEGAHLGNLGNAWSDLGEVRKSIEFYTQALVIHKDMGDRLGEGHDLGNLGVAWSVMGEVRKSIGFYEQALAIDKETGDRGGEGNHLDNLGNAWSYLGEVRKAIGFYEQALAIAKEIGDRRGEGYRLGNLGCAWYYLGESRKAIEYYLQALAISREIGDRSSEGNHLGNLGIAWSDLGEPRKAIEFYTQVLAIFKEINNRLGEGTSLGNLGSAYFDLKDYDKAVEYYQEQLNISQQIDDRHGEGYANWGIAICQQEIGDREQAIQHARAALELFTAIESPSAEQMRKLLADLEQQSA